MEEVEYLEEYEDVVWTTSDELLGKDSNSNLYTSSGTFYETNQNGDNIVLYTDEKAEDNTSSTCDADEGEYFKTCDEFPKEDILTQFNYNFNIEHSYNMSQEKEKFKKPKLAPILCKTQKNSPNNHNADKLKKKRVRWEFDKRRAIEIKTKENILNQGFKNVKVQVTSDGSRSKDLKGKDSYENVVLERKETCEIQLDSSKRKDILEKGITVGDKVQNIYKRRNSELDVQSGLQLENKKRSPAIKVFFSNWPDISDSESDTLEKYNTSSSNLEKSLDKVKQDKLEDSKGLKSNDSSEGTTFMDVFTTQLKSSTTLHETMGKRQQTKEKDNTASEKCTNFQAVKHNESENNNVSSKKSMVTFKERRVKIVVPRLEKIDVHSPKNTKHLMKKLKVVLKRGEVESILESYKAKGIYDKTPRKRKQVLITKNEYDEGNMQESKKMYFKGYAKSHETLNWKKNLKRKLIGQIQDNLESSSNLVTKQNGEFIESEALHEESILRSLGIVRKHGRKSVTATNVNDQEESKSSIDQKYNSLNVTQRSLNMLTPNVINATRKNGGVKEFFSPVGLLSLQPQVKVLDTYRIPAHIVVDTKFITRSDYLKKGFGAPEIKQISSKKPIHFGVTTVPVKSVPMVRKLIPVNTLQNTKLNESGQELQPSNVQNVMQAPTVTNATKEVRQVDSTITDIFEKIADLINDKIEREVNKKLKEISDSFQAEVTPKEGTNVPSKKKKFFIDCDLKTARKIYDSLREYLLDQPSKMELDDLDKNKIILTNDQSKTQTTAAIVTATPPILNTSKAVPMISKKPAVESIINKAIYKVLLTNSPSLKIQSIKLLSQSGQSVNNLPEEVTKALNNYSTKSAKVGTGVSSTANCVINPVVISLDENRKRQSEIILPDPLVTIKAENYEEETEQRNKSSTENTTTNSFSKNTVSTTPSANNLKNSSNCIDLTSNDKVVSSQNTKQTESSKVSNSDNGKLLKNEMSTTVLPAPVQEDTTVKLKSSSENPPQSKVNLYVIEGFNKNKAFEASNLPRDLHYVEEYSLDMGYIYKCKRCTVILSSRPLIQEHVQRLHFKSSNSCYICSTQLDQPHILQHFLEAHSMASIN